jgi:hypothetical protein
MNWLFIYFPLLHQLERMPVEKQGVSHDKRTTITLPVGYDARLSDIVRDRFLPMFRIHEEPMPPVPLCLVDLETGDFYETSIVTCPLLFRANDQMCLYSDSQKRLLAVSWWGDGWEGGERRREVTLELCNKM